MYNYKSYNIYNYKKHFVIFTNSIIKQYLTA